MRGYLLLDDEVNAIKSNNSSAEKDFRMGF